MSEIGHSKRNSLLALCYLFHFNQRYIFNLLLVGTVSWIAAGGLTLPRALEAISVVSDQEPARGPLCLLRKRPS